MERLTKVMGRRKKLINKGENELILTEAKRISE